MVFVTASCAPMTAGAVAESIQVKGGVKLSVDCSVNPTTFVDQERISLIFMLASPLDRAEKGGLNASGKIDPTAAVGTVKVQPGRTGQRVGLLEDHARGAGPT